MAIDNAWLSRRVIGFAHQGGAAEGPPNTIETMRRALDNGCAALEFDLHLTRDNQLVLQHDPELIVEGNAVKIADTDLDALRAIQPDLATVNEVLAAFPEVPLTVEVKAPKAAELAARILAEEPGDRPVIVSAFAPGTVAAVKRVAPGLDTAPGWPTNFGFWLLSRLWSSPPLGSGHVALQVPLRLDQVAIVKRVPLLRRLRIADRRLVNAAHRRGLAVHVWTLNDEGAMRAAIEFGADGIFTDCPSVLTTTLNATDNYWSC
ncbi:MAG TPA: glycerophosphodiester phosphodiesterase family protein [Ilumatobacteraceae bacterium]|nr:glycerophosphodiester phosphodiesterase family protein [Ilumatobacteraceae bacterium]